MQQFAIQPVFVPRDELSKRRFVVRGFIKCATVELYPPVARDLRDGTNALGSVQFLSG